MPEATENADVSQVLSAIRELMENGRAPARAAPLLLTPEQRVAGPKRLGAAPVATADPARPDESTAPLQATRTQAGAAGLLLEHPSLNGPQPNDVPKAGSPAPNEAGEGPLLLRDPKRLERLVLTDPLADAPLVLQHPLPAAGLDSRPSPATAPFSPEGHDPAALPRTIG